jgi:hypothetical protein
MIEDGGLVLWEFRHVAFYAEAFADPYPGDRILRLVAAFDMPVALLSMVGEIAMLVGLGSHQMTDDDREWWARSAAWIAIVAAAWAAAGVLALYGPGAIRHIVASMPVHPNLARALLTIVTFVGGLAATRQASAVASQPTKSIGDRLQQIALALAIPACLTATLAIVVYADIAVLHRMRDLPMVAAFSKLFEPFGIAIPLEEDFWHIRAPEVWLLFVVLIAGGLAMSRLISVNIFSLHGMPEPDRAQLPRLVAAVAPAESVHRLRRRRRRGDVDLRLLPRPLHVVNITLNQVTDNQMAWQERRALPFTVTPLHAGCSNPVGFAARGITATGSRSAPRSRSRAPRSAPASASGPHRRWPFC